MIDLDNLASMKKLDPSGVLESTGLFAKQCEQAWRESRLIDFPQTYSNVKNIIVCGMGGSRFTPRTIKELFSDSITVPYEIVEDYVVPGYVNSDTLVILSSYSGTTEEVVSAGNDAYKKGAKISGLAMGGKVIDFLNSIKAPSYQFNPINNPCGQPRIGGGYLLFGHMGLLTRLGFLQIEESEVEKAIYFVFDLANKYQAGVKTENNSAKQLAKTLKDHHIFVITSEFLKGFGNGFANQINETAKMISDSRHISELNHHLLEGLKRPDSLKNNGLFAFVNSKFYSPQISKRYPITKDVVEKQGLATYVVDLTGESKLAQVLEAFTLSGFTTFYMAMLYDTDPVAIPWVDFFKKELAK